MHARTNAHWNRYISVCTRAWACAHHPHMHALTHIPHKHTHAHKHTYNIQKNRHTHINSLTHTHTHTHAERMRQRQTGIRQLITSSEDDFHFWVMHFQFTQQSPQFHLLYPLGNRKHNSKLFTFYIMEALKYCKQNYNKTTGFLNPPRCRTVKQSNNWGRACIHLQMKKAETDTLCHTFRMLRVRFHRKSYHSAHLSSSQRLAISTSR